MTPEIKDMGYLSTKNSHSKILSIDDFYIEILKRETRYLVKKKYELKFNIRSDSNKLHELKSKCSITTFSTLEQLENSCKPYAFYERYYSTGCTGGWSVAGEIMRTYTIRKTDYNFPSFVLDQASYHTDILEHIKSIYRNRVYTRKMETLSEVIKKNTETYRILEGITEEDIRAYVDGSFNCLIPATREDYPIEIAQAASGGVYYPLKTSRYMFHNAKNIMVLEPLTQYIEKQLADVDCTSFKYKGILVDLLTNSWSI